MTLLCVFRRRPADGGFRVSQGLACTIRAPLVMLLYVFPLPRTPISSHCSKGSLEREMGPFWMCIKVSTVPDAAQTKSYNV